MAALTVVVRQAREPYALRGRGRAVRVALPAAPGEDCVATVFAAVAPRGLPRGMHSDGITVSVPNLRLLAPDDAVGRHAYGDHSARMRLIAGRRASPAGGAGGTKAPKPDASFSLRVVAAQRADRCGTPLALLRWRRITGGLVLSA
jgi:hypothetical protein